MSIYDRFNNSSESIQSEIRAALVLSEGSKPGIHLDGKNILTFASGSALARPDGGLYPLEYINARLTKAGQSPLSSEAYDLLKAVGNKPEAERKSSLDLLIKTNSEIKNINTNEEQRKNLLNFELGEQAKLIDNIIVELVTSPQAVDLYSNLTENQFSAILQIGYNNPKKLVGPDLVGALARNDDWAAFKEILIKSNGGTNSKDYEGVQKRRFLEAAKFSPFSGEGGKPINPDGSVNVNEIHRILGHYDDSTVSEFISYFKSKNIALSKAESGLTENVNNFFPYRTIQEAIEAIRLTNPQIAHDLEVNLSNVARCIEKYVRSIYKSPSWTLHQVQDPGDTVKPALLPYAPDDFHVPIESTANDPSRYVNIKDAIVEVAGVTSVEYSVVYFGVVWKFETNEERREFVARRKYLWAPTSNPDTNPPDHPEELGVTVTSDRISPGDNQPIEPGSFYIDGNILNAGLTTLANGIASQQFRIHNPVVATLVDSAVARATDEVSTSVLTELDIKVAALPRDFSTRLQSGMVAGLTSLVSSMVATRLLDVIGIDGLPADVITGLVSNTASTFVVSQLGLSLAGEGTVLSLSDAFAGSLAAVPAGIIGNQILNALNIQNPTARMAGNVASAIVLASSSAGPVVAAAAMVATTVVFNVLGIGTNAGPYGYVDLEAANGRFQASRPRTNRNGFKGPAEQLTMTVEMLMSEAVPVLNAALDVLNAQASPMAARTSLRFYLSDNEIRSYVNDNLVKYDIAGRGVVTRDFIERVLVGATLSIPSDADPILAKVLRRGWYDWVINSVDPEYRASLPEDDDVYAQHDLTVWINQTVYRVNASQLPFRAPRGTTAEIVAGLVSDLRHAAGNVESSLIAFIRHSVNSSYPIAGLGDPTTSFERLDSVIGSLVTLAQKRGFVCPTMPTDGPWPLDMPTVQDGYEYLYEMLGRVRAWKSLASQPLVQSAEMPIAIPVVLATVGIGSFDPSASGVAHIRVHCQALGAGEQLGVKWQLVETETTSALWNFAEFPPLRYLVPITPVSPGSRYVVQVRRVAVVNGVRRVSAWTEPKTVEIPTGLKGAQATRVEISQQGTDPVWAGRDVHINWEGSFPALGDAADMASSVAAPLDTMLGYGVKVFDADTDALMREVSISTDRRYVYPYEDNVVDSRGLGRPGPRRRLRFEVSIIPKSGPPQGSQSLTVNNPAPEKVTLSATAGTGYLSIDINPVQDLDLDGYVVWVSSNADFDPASTTPVYRGASPHYIHTPSSVGTWYVRAAAVDLFQPRDHLDLNSLNVSDKVSVILKTLEISASQITAGQIESTRLKVFSRQYRMGDIVIEAEKLDNTVDNLNNLRIRWGKKSGSDFVDGQIEIDPQETGTFVKHTIKKGSHVGTVGTPVYIFWRPSETSFQATPDISNLLSNDVLLANIRSPVSANDQSGGLSGPLPAELSVTGNILRAGQVNARVMRAGEMVVEEIRIGPEVTSRPGIYMRTAESTTFSRLNAQGVREDLPVEQQSLFCFDGTRRRVQLYSHKYEAGLVAWDSAGNPIFDSNGLGRSTVGVSALRPESATFVRSCVAWNKATLKITVSGLAPGETAKVVIFANGNGAGAEVNTLLQVRGLGFVDDWSPSSFNYIGFKGDGQGLLVREAIINVNGTYGWSCWCSEGVGSLSDITAKAETPLPSLVGLVVMVSMR